MRVRACARARARACVRARECVRECVSACVRACVRVCVRARVRKSDFTVKIMSKIDAHFFTVKSTRLLYHVAAAVDAARCSAIAAYCGILWLIAVVAVWMWRGAVGKRFFALVCALSRSFCFVFRICRGACARVRVCACARE